METELRGIVEKHLDLFLKEENLSLRAENYRKFQELGLVKSLDDALFGALFECLALIIASIKVPMGLTMTDVEIEELYNIIKNRSLEINSKISQTTNL